MGRAPERHLVEARPQVVETDSNTEATSDAYAATDELVGTTDASNIEARIHDGSDDIERKIGNLESRLGGSPYLLGAAAKGVAISVPYSAGTSYDRGGIRSGNMACVKMPA
jgi:hypothetical protein